MKILVGWDDQEARVGGVQELDDLLDRLQREFAADLPHLVTVELEAGDSLAIGLGLPWSVLSFVAASREPPYYVSVGDGGFGQDIGFVFGGELSEYPSRNVIPLSVARTALRQFCLTGSLPATVSWEDA